ncbi:MAG: flagellar biosynthesis protein FlhB [Nitrospira sp.]
MADSDKSSRTEEATEKRKSTARSEGQVAMSRDVGTAAVLIGGIGFLAIGVPIGLRQLTDVTRRGLSLSFDETFWKTLTIDHIHTIIVQTSVTTLLLILPILGVILFMGTGASLAQTGFMWRPNALQPNFGKLNPINGLGKLFSMRSVMELIKGLLKIAIIIGVALFTARHDLLMVPALMDYDLPASLEMAGHLTLKVAMGVTGALAVLAAVDYFYQRFEWSRDLRMTKEEVKEEHKAAEGDPLVRGRIRTAQRDLAKKRMMAAVQTADVVVTNPTHLAVALKYDASQKAAPFVVAKGAGFIAERIRELARHHGVAVVENKLVARTLYRLVDIGKEIPSNLYRAVAEILAFVYRARGVNPGQF